MEKSKKKNSQPGKINFIERNRLLASKKKTAESEKEKNSTKPTIPPDAPLNPNRPKTAGAVSRNPSVAPSKENLRPISAPTATKSKISLKRRNTSDKDLVSKMIDRNLYEPLLRIFLSLSSTTLTACREVCTSWYSYTKLVFWKQIRVRRELEERLAEHWLNKKLHKVELKVGGLACKQKCVENFRECPCKDKLDCAINGNSLVVEFGGDSFYGEYVTNDKKVDIEREKFNIEQFQLNFHLKLDLKLEISNWLNTAVHIKKKPLKLKLEFDSMTIERHPADPTYLMIKDKDTMELKHKFQPYTKTASKQPIDGLLYSCGRLAVLTGGQVFVYCTNTLARGNNGGALRLVANRDKDPEVHFMFLNENVLVTVGGCKVTMYDFWRFTWTPAIKDFQT